MQRLSLWRKQFSWRMLLVRVAVNALALLFTVAVLPHIYFIDRSVVTWLLLAVALGVLNAVIKPIIQFLTLRFIFATYGLVLALINGVMLVLLELLFPAHFAIEGLIFWPLVGGAVLGIVSAVLENLLGLSPPIVSEKYPEVRRRIREKTSDSLESHITETAVSKTLRPSGAEQGDDSAASAAAVLAVIGADAGQPAAPDGDGVETPHQQPEAAAAPAEQEV